MKKINTICLSYINFKCNLPERIAVSKYDQTGSNYRMNTLVEVIFLKMISQKICLAKVNTYLSSVSLQTQIKLKTENILNIAFQLHVFL